MNKLICAVIIALSFTVSVAAIGMAYENAKIGTQKNSGLRNRGIFQFEGYGKALEPGEGYRLVLYNVDDATDYAVTKEIAKIKSIDPTVQQVLFMYSGPNMGTVTTIPMRKKTLEVPYSYSFFGGLEFQ